MDMLKSSWVLTDFTLKLKKKKVRQVIGIYI